MSVGAQKDTPVFPNVERMLAGAQNDIPAFPNVGRMSVGAQKDTPAFPNMERRCKSAFIFVFLWKTYTI
jgi:hypothetical protein